MELELQQIQQLLDAPRQRIRFSSPLETDFRLYLQKRALATLSHGWWTVLLFYLGIGISSYFGVQLLSDPLFRAGNFQVLWTVYLLEGGAIAGMLLLPRLPALHKGYCIYTGLITVLALAAIIIATSAFPDPYFNQHSSYMVIFVTAIVYAIGGLRFRSALVSCGAAVLISYAVIRMCGLWLDWGFFSQYVLLANVVGMMLCYVLEHRDRMVFLQVRLLALEKSRLDCFSRELSRLSREDVLTGLPNRRHFNEIFQMEWDRAKRDQLPLSLILADIDHFKLFNDSQGHLAGDGALTEVGMTLRDCLQRPGDLVARYGGEEFVLLLPRTPRSGAKEMALQVRSAIEALGIPHQASTVAAYLTASVGVATLVPSPEMRSTQLFGLADEALYAAKSAGRNCIVQADETDIALVSA